MSRIGRMPLAVPNGVTVALDGQHVTVKGPKGELQRALPAEMLVTLDEGVVRVARPSDSTRHRSLHGLTRSLLHNMVSGVTEGFEKSLEIHGVGYKAEQLPTGVRLLVGYSHPVEYAAPAGVTITVENPTLLKISGIDKEMVGQVAAELRRVRPPEPYKGKGIRYVGEHVRRKAGKTGG
jgi:large subunit ribosomal protein L6